VRVTSTNIVLCHSEALLAYVRRIPPNLTSDLFLEQFWHILPELGAPVQAVERYREIAHAFRLGIGTSKSRMQRLQHTALQYPYTHCLLTTLATFEKRHRAVQMWETGPLLARAQVEAIASAWDGVLLRDAASFTYCPVCLRPYTLAQEFASNNKHQYRYGFMGPVVNLTTGKMYCRRDQPRTCGHERCTDIPLVTVPLLGRVLQLQSKLYTICPQLGCALPMVLDPEYCAYNERGPSCYRCTYRIYEERDEAVLRAASPFVQRMYERRGTTTATELLRSIHCLWCERPIVNPAFMHIIGYGTFLCKKHGHHLAVFDFIRRELEERGLQPFPAVDNPTWETVVREAVPKWRKVAAGRYAMMVKARSNADHKAQHKIESARRVARSR